MPADTLETTLAAELARVPLVDPHSHIDPHSPASKSLADVLGYHYYTELAHSAGVPAADVAVDTPPRDKVRAVLGALERFDNTAQAAWLTDICRRFLGFTGERVTAADADSLFDAAETTFARPGWADEVFRASNLERVFLTNEFDEPLEGFDTRVYVPCLRTDAIVFQLADPAVRARLTKATGVDAGDSRSLRDALGKLFAHFVRHGAKACAISLPPDFSPTPVTDADLDRALLACDAATIARGVFWRLAELCDAHRLPFDLMIGVNRRVYEAGVFQGQDLFDRRTSLIQYKALFNAFPRVVFPVSVLTSGQNQELVAYSWVFPNVRPFGHWWYSNVPRYIRRDLAERLDAVPRTKLLGYYSDAYKLEFVAPKYAMYVRELSDVLAADFVRPGRLTETQAVELGTQLLRGNVLDTFGS